MKRLLFLVLFVFAFSVFVSPLPATAAAVAPPPKILKLTSPVRRNANAKLIIQTVPGVKCNLVYRAPSGRVSTAKGLGPKVADKKGKCSWSWKIGTSTSPGTGQLVITANNQTIRKPIIIK